MDGKFKIDWMDLDQQGNVQSKINKNLKEVGKLTKIG